MPRAKNGAEKGSILLKRRLALAILLLFIYGKYEQPLLSRKKNIEHMSDFGRTNPILGRDTARFPLLHRRRVYTEGRRCCLGAGFIQFQLPR